MADNLPLYWADAEPSLDGKALRACELYYVANLSQKEIAIRLRVSPATVSRLLQHARDRGLVRVSICPPEDLMLGRQLLAALRHYGVRQVVVTPGGRGSVATAAARLFEEHLVSGDTVVLDGGWTVGDFVDALQIGVVEAVNIVPLCADPSSYATSAYELMALMARKYSRAQCLRLPHHRGKALKPIRQEVVRLAKTARFVILGAGPWHKGFTAFDFVTFLGLSPADIKRKHREIVALCGYCALSAEGDHIRLPEVEWRMPRALTFRDLQSLAANEKCTVALLIAGAEKVAPLIPILKARLMNVLVVDQEIGRGLAQRVADSTWR